VLDYIFSNLYTYITIYQQNSDASLEKMVTLTFKYTRLTKDEKILEKLK